MVRPADVAIVTPTWVNGAGVSNWSWDLIDGNRRPVSQAVSPRTPRRRQSHRTVHVRRSSRRSALINRGNIVATFGSGQSVKLAQLAMASFNNPKGLFKLGANLYGESGAAGLPNIGTAGSGGKGTLIGSALETSNVRHRRGVYQDDPRTARVPGERATITVSDELLLETLNPQAIVS